MTAESSLPALSEAQLEIMQIVWERGGATVGEVWKELDARRTLARNTVLTLMDRLVQKGWLSRKPHAQAFQYRATVPRERALGGVVRRLVDTAFGGSAEGLVMTLIDSGGLSAEEAARIRKLIDAARRKPS
jgi:predicted transcriptional regulator